MIALRHILRRHRWTDALPPAAEATRRAVPIRWEGRGSEDVYVGHRRRPAESVGCSVLVRLYLPSFAR